MIGIALGIAGGEDHLVEDAAARGGGAVVARRGDAARHRGRNRLGRLPGAPRVAARSHRSAAARDMRLFATLSHALEGVCDRARIDPRQQGTRRAHDPRRRGRRVRRRRAVVGRARRQRVVRARRRRRGPDVVLRVPATDQRLPELRPERPELVSRAAQPGDHQRRGARASRRCRRSTRSRSTWPSGAHVQVQGSLAERRRRVLHAELDRRRRRRHLPGPQLHAGGIRTPARAS